MNTALAYSLQSRSDNQARVANLAAQLWEQSPPPVVHPWLTAKGVQAHGIRQRDGRLIVPMRDTAGKIWNLQFIGPGGSSRFMHGGRVVGLYHLIGAARRDVVCIAEDYATAARVYALTGQPVAVAFQLNNLRPVALALHDSEPRARCTIWVPAPPVGAGGLHQARMNFAAADAAARAVNGAVATLRGDA